MRSIASKGRHSNWSRRGASPGWRIITHVPGGTVLVAAAVTLLGLLPQRTPGEEVAQTGTVIARRYVSIEDPAVIALKRPGRSPRSVAREIQAHFGKDVGVRIPIHPLPVEGTPGFDANPQAYIESYLEPLTDLLEEEGIPYILDYHVVEELDAESAAAAIEFWQRLAPRYKESRLAALELFNEAIKPADWEGYRAQIQPVVDAVRAEGVENALLVGAGNWNRSFAGVKEAPVTGGHIVYSPHLYPAHYTGPDTLSAALDDLIEMDVPVVLAETGFDTDPTADEWLRGTAVQYREFLAYADENGLAVGAWCYSATWGPPMLNADRTLNEFGRTFRDACRSFSYDHHELNQTPTGTKNWGAPSLNNLVDGNPSTATELNEGSSFGIRFEETATWVDAIKFYSLPQGYGQNHVTQFRVEGLVDDAWVVLVEQRGGVTAPGWTEVSFEPTSVEEIRVVPVSVSFGGAPDLGEIAVRGAADLPAPAASLEGELIVEQASITSRPSLLAVTEDEAISAVLTPLGANTYRYFLDPAPEGAFRLLAFVDRNGNGEKDGGEVSDSAEVGALAGPAAGPRLLLDMSTEFDGEGAWLWEVFGSGTVEDSYAFGVHPNAADDTSMDGFDAGLPPAAPGEVGAVVSFVTAPDDLLVSYRIDVRSGKDNPTWYLAIIGGEQAATLTWAPPDGYAGAMTMVELDADGAPASGGAHVDMIRQNQFDIPPDSPARIYRIATHETSVAITLLPGWNLISMPIEPAQPATEAIFANSAVDTESAWQWNAAESRYEHAEELHAFDAVWVFLDAADQETVTVFGSVSDQTEIELQRGWNMIGPTNEPANLPMDDAAIWPEAFWYDTPSGNYKTTEKLLPCTGYWLQVLAETTIVMP